MKYRMYVDEVGNSDLGASADPNHRYLSLTGVIFKLGYVDQVVFPRVEDLKRRYFGSHPDEPVILHRKELVNKKYPFEALKDLNVESAFNTELLSLLRELDYTVITAIIDKQEHQKRYSVWKFDPYHYCLTVLVERFARWLELSSFTGDVMAESRGGKEDSRLKASFERLYEQGSDYMKHEVFAAVLTSRQLKVKAKANNIAGLQIADLIAHPSFRGALARRKREPLTPNFGSKIVAILEETKYQRSPNGRVQGWGVKWLP